jgi:hypothetical protein
MLASDNQEVYVVPDGRDRCLWLQMTGMGVCTVGCPKEVYVVSNGRERGVCVGLDDFPGVMDVVLFHFMVLTWSTCFVVSSPHIQFYFIFNLIHPYLRKIIWVGGSTLVQ